MKTRGLGPHSRRHRLGNLDGRTYEAKLYNGFRAGLIAHVGGNPSVPQRALIERCAWVQLRLAMMDSKVGGGQLTEQDTICYLAWSNTLGRLLEKLGFDPAETKPSLSFVDHLAAIDARRRQPEEAA